MAHSSEENQRYVNRPILGSQLVGRPIASLKPMTDVFVCDLLTTEYHDQVTEAITTLAKSVVPCTCDGASMMVYLQ